MTGEHVIRRRYWVVAIAIIIGLSMEFFLIPLHPQHDIHGPEWLKGLLTSGDLYYALVFPLALWWWFARFLRRRQLELRELGIAYLVFGIYLSSALRAIASTIVQLMHLVN